MLADTPMLAAIASPRRREILRLVWSEELEAGRHSSRHAGRDVRRGVAAAARLVDAGLVESRAEGRHRLYRARREALGPVGRMLEGMWSDALWRLKLQAELLRARRGPGPARAKRVDKRQPERESAPS